MKHNAITQIKNTYQSIQNKKPLILNLTNDVTMQWVANVELAVGASPLMSICSNEFGEILQHADALYINLGTLDEGFIEDSLLAAKIAKQLNKPIILDPVGCGFTKLRTEAAVALLPYADVVRGNASELQQLDVLSIEGESKSLISEREKVLQKGIDSLASVESTKMQAQSIAKKYNCICVVTGKDDFICHAKQSTTLSFGSGLMTKITGMGCALGGVLSAFTASNNNSYQACVEAILFYTLSAQHVGSYCSLGQFSNAFIDTLHYPDWQVLQTILESEV